MLYITTLYRNLLKIKELHFNFTENNCTWKLYNEHFCEIKHGLVMFKTIKNLIYIMLENSYSVSAGYTVLFCTNYLPSDDVKVLNEGFIAIMANAPI